MKKIRGMCRGDLDGGRMRMVKPCVERLVVEGRMYVWESIYCLVKSTGQ